MKVYSSIVELIGNTPLLKLDRLKKEFGLKANLYAKLEYFNPAGSVKDRVALKMIVDAENSGKINRDSVIIEPTSGNTGIGLSLIASAKGYKTIIVMPDNMSEERISLMQAYGAEVVLTDGKLGMHGAIDKAEEIAKTTPNSFIAGQFVNPSNPKAHYETTGKEIYNDLEGNIDIFVASIGTGGTITGVSKYLKEKNANIKVIGVEPFDSPYITKGQKGVHKLQGIGAGFIPEVLDLSLIDGVETVTTEQAYNTGKLLAKTEGVFAGISSGASLYTAITLAKKEENLNKNIVVLLPDGGDRYLSTDYVKILR